MQSCDLAVTVTALACTIAKCCPKDELPIMSAIFNQLGDTIATIIAQEEACSEDAKD